MKIKLILSGCIFMLLLSSTVFAVEGLYISGNAGYSLLSDSQLHETSGSLTVTTDAEFDADFIIGAAIGKVMDQGRIELALDYKSYEVEKFKNFNATGFGNLGDFTGTGDVTILSLLINGFYDIDMESPVAPYIGAGIGFAHIDLEDITIAGYSLGNSDDTVFAFQLGTGIGFAIDESITIDVGYRYFRTEDPEFDGTEAKINTHDFILGLRKVL
jgi:opacity protein-like surface antigen